MWMSQQLPSWAMIKCRKIPNSDLESHICPPPGKEPPSRSRTAKAFVCNSARRKKGLIYFQNWSKFFFFLDILLCKKNKFSLVFLFPAFLSAGHQLNVNLAFLQQHTVSAKNVHAIKHSDYFHWIDIILMSLLLVEQALHHFS